MGGFILPGDHHPRFSMTVQRDGAAHLHHAVFPKPGAGRVKQGADYAFIRFSIQCPEEADPLLPMGRRDVINDGGNAPHRPRTPPGEKILHGGMAEDRGLARIEEVPLLNIQRWGIRCRPLVKHAGQLYEQRAILAGCD